MQGTIEYSLDKLVNNNNYSTNISYLKTKQKNKWAMDKAHKLLKIKHKVSLTFSLLFKN